MNEVLSLRAISLALAVTTGACIQANGGTAADGAVAPDLCPDFQSVNVCVPASSDACVNGNAMIGCGLAGLPTGRPCSENAQCSLTVFPCPGEVQSFAGAGRTDGYICTCVGSKWSCDDCDLGTAICDEAGASGEGGH
jgi:hypothetical protein